MWWGGGGSNQGQEQQKEGDPTTPIAIAGRRRRTSDESLDSPPSSSPLSSSLASSYGSPSTDLAELRDLKNNFSNQEQLLGQLRDALQSNNQRLQSKEKEDYASRLAQMRQNRKGGAGALPARVEPHAEEEKEEEGGGGGKKSRGARMQMLRKQLEESKARQQAELSSRQDLENIVAGLQRELEERDSMIQSMQLGSVSGSVTSSVLGSPFVMSPEQGSPTDSPGNTTPPAGYSEGYGSSGSYYDLKELLSAKENKILEQNEQIAHFNRKVWDLEESLKEKDEIISARTQAVGLASASLAAKGRDTLEQLEDTRKELRNLQDNWSREQGEWRREREETRILLEGANARVESLQEANKRLERNREEVGSKNQELRETVGRLEEEVSSLKSRAREEKIFLEAKVEEIEEAKSAMEEKHLKKEEILEKRIETLQSKSSKSVGKGKQGQKIAELENALAEAEEEIGALQLKLVDLEEMTAAELKLKARVKDAEESSRRIGDELDSQRRAVGMAESEKVDLMEAVATRDTEIEALQAEISKLVLGREELARGRLELEIRCVQLEEEKDRWEEDKLKFLQEIEEIKIKSAADLLPLDELKIKHSELVAEHEKFREEHAAAVERSKLYDKDMLDKARKIKEQSIDLKTLENLLHEKTKEISYQLSEVDLKEKDLIKAKETIVNFENVISKKESELTELKNILDESEEHSKLIEMKERISELEKDLTILIEDKSSLEKDAGDKKVHVENLQESFDQQKEELNILLEQKNIELININENNNELLKKIKELEETIESQVIEIKEQKQKLDASLMANEEIRNSNDIITKSLNEAKLKLETSEASLEDQRIKFDELKNSSESNATELNQEIDIKLNSHKNEIESFKQNILEKEESALKQIKEIEKLTNELLSKNEEIKTLETSLDMKSEEIQTMNEEVMSKYKIIEDLQSQIESLEQSNDEERTQSSTNESLRAEILDLKKQNEYCEAELISKASALERLQTVFDVCEEQSQKAKDDLAEKSKEIIHLKKEFDLLNAEKSVDNNDETKKLYVQIEEMSITLTSLQQMKETYEEKIRTLENENSSLEELSIDISEYRKQILSKDAEIDSLREKLETKTLELSKKDVEIFDDKQSQIGKLFEKHDIEQVEMLQKQLKEKDEFYEKQKMDLIEKHQLQLEEKDKFEKSSKIDDTLKAKLDEINSLLEEKTEEIEKLKIQNTDLESERNRMESKMAEIEQFRQEVAKEANQHMEETGDKMRELKTQFENKQEEVNRLLEEKEEAELSAKKMTDDLKSLQNKYNDAVQNSSNADMIKEKHLLKEKNEKLTNMCKKYIAKIKQQEAALKEKEGMVENDKIEEYNEKIANFEKEITEARSENEILMEEMTAKYQIIEDLQNQLSQKEADCEKWERECNAKENILIQKETEKDDIIRNLKQKLEDAPEDISIPVNIAEATLAHEKTKTELLNLKEKCKKLIVKVKQQDAQIKRKARDSTSSEASTVVNDDIEQLSEENEKLKKENMEFKKTYEEFSTSSGQEIEKLKNEIEDIKKSQGVDLEDIKRENMELKEKFDDIQTKIKSQETDFQKKNSKLEEKLEAIKKERTSLYEEQIALKETIKDLNITNQSLKLKSEEASKELKKVREDNIVNQMASSPMLNQDRDVAIMGDGDDGWGSPEPEEEKLPIEPEAESDGWGGWGDAENVKAEEKSSDDEDGLRNNSEGQKVESAKDEGWGGWDEELTTPSPTHADQDANIGQNPIAFPDGPRNDGGPSVEREADIEDGWGDDSWGGFGGESVQGNSVLAANLRIGEKDDDGLADVARSSESEITRTDYAGTNRIPDDSPSDHTLEGKIAEKESVIESIEIELKNTQQKLGMVEDELISVQEEKDEIEKQFADMKKQNKKQDSENENLKEQILEISKEADNMAILKKDSEQLKAEFDKIEERSKEISEENEKLQEKIQGLENASKTMETLMGVEERYKECLTTISNLEEQNIQAEMNAEAIESNLKADIDKKQLEIISLEAEIKNLNEQLETSENRLTDLNETVGHLSERRNSLDTSVGDLRSTISSQKEEIESYKNRIAEMEIQGDRTDEVQHLKNQIDEYNGKVKAKTEETEQLSILRDNLFSEITILKNNYDEQVNLNKEYCENLSDSESRLNALQLELQGATNLAKENEEKMKSSKDDLEKELNSLRSMVMDVTSENETLQTELGTAQNQISADQDRINQLQTALDAASRPAIQHPPPDITNNGQQPDVAARNLNPDIMGGPMNPGPDIMQGQGNVNPDIMVGAQPQQQRLDLVQEQQQGWGWGGNNDAEGAGWFDNFDPEPVQPQLPNVEQVQQHNISREQELQQTVSVHLNTIRQHETTIQEQQIRIQELNSSIKQQEEMIQQKESMLEQCKNSDSNNLKAIEQLEATIWQVTDEKQQMALIKDNIEVEIKEMMNEMENLRAQNTNTNNENEQLKAQLNQTSTCEAQLARQHEQLLAARTSLEQLTNDYNKISSQLEEAKACNDKFKEQNMTTQHTSDITVSGIPASQPVAISQQVENTEHQYQSPPPTVFNWNTAAGNIEQNTSSLFAMQTSQDQSAASFFEDIGAQSSLPQVDNYFEGIDAVQAGSPAQQTPVYQQEPQPNSPHSNSYNELRNLQDQLRMKVVHSEQLSSDLSDLKHQLEVKQSESENLQQALEQTRKENEQKLYDLQANICDSNNTAAENERLKQQVKDLTDSLSNSNANIEKLTGQLVMKDGVSSTNTEEIPSTGPIPKNDGQPPSTASLFAQDEATQSTASLFGQNETPSTASLFGQAQEMPSTASLFSQESTTNLTGKEETSSTASLFAPAQTTENENNTENSAYSLPSVDQLKPEEMLANLTWYQAELAQYQQACADWQIWGETKTQEMNELNETLSFQIEAFTIKKSENEKLLKQIQEQEVSGQKNDVQNVLKVKELEVLDLKETVERLESEKQELSEEIEEMRSTIDELRRINENVETYKDDSELLLDTKNNLEESEKERAKLISELTDLRNEMATISFSNDKTIKDLRNEMEEKRIELQNLSKKDLEANDKIHNLEKSLAEEKKMQEEIGDEYESMQLQVQESSSKISELLDEINKLKEGAELRSSKDESFEDNKNPEVTLEDEEMKEKVLRITEELDQYKQTCLDWNAWSEVKTLEYNQLLEAYNQYVEAYNNMKVEFDNVLEQSVKSSEYTDDKQTVEKELTDNTSIIKQLKEEIEEKEKELAFSTVEKDSEIEKLKITVEEKSKELEELLGVEERYKSSLKNITDLEEQIVQADMNAETTELKLKEETAEKQSLIVNLQQEIANLTNKMSTQKTTEDDSSINQLRDELNSKSKEVEELLGVEERYKNSLQNISDLERQLVQADMNAEATEIKLKEEIEVKCKELEGKSLEYNTLLEAYNQYVVAYDHLNNEYASLQVKSGETMVTDNSSNSNTLSDSHQDELKEKAKMVEDLQRIIMEKDGEIQRLKQQVELKEKELVDKTCTVAKLSIGSALSSQLSKSLQVMKQTSTEIKPVEKVLEIANQSSENIMPEEPIKIVADVETEQPWEEPEGWGVEETAEIQQSSSSEIILLETEISELRQKVRNMEEDKSKAVDEINSTKLKNGKLLVKVKQLNKEVESLKKNKNAPAELDDLDRALQDEIKHQAEKCQSELKETKKELDNVKLEKDNLSKKLDTLETANERLVDMKEKQDNEVEFLQHKNKGLENQIDGLNWNITELEERRTSEVAELNNKLSVFTSQSDENVDSNQLKIEIASLKSQLNEANNESDRLRADLAAINEALVLAQSETATVKSQIIDLQDSIDRLVNEKETLRFENDSLKESTTTGSEGFEEIQKLNETLNSEIASLKHYIENQNLYTNPPIISPSQETSEIEHLKSQLLKEQKLVLQLEQDLQAKESSLELLESELMSVRDQKSQHEVELQSKFESPRESLDREVFSAFTDKDLVSENLRLKADLDSSMRERRQMAGCIQNWTEELNREEIDQMGEDGLRNELRVAIRTLQIKDHKCEEVTQENLRLLEERDTLMLKLSTVMRQLEGSRTASAMSSMAGSRTTTPVPGGMPSLMPHFDPHAEIRGLHAKLEELRRLNYNLDVELQRERGDRQAMGQRVMAPRSRHASQMLPEGKKSESPEKVQHI